MNGHAATPARPVFSSEPPPFWTASNIAHTVAGRWLKTPQNAEQPLTGVSIDTRTITPRQLFMAIVGPTFDGHDFLDTAFDRGASLAIVGKPIDSPSGPTLQVADPVAALQQLARAYRPYLARAGVTVIAVAGSNGKTTTRHLIHTALQHAVPNGRSQPLTGTQSPASFNNHLGVPLTLLAARCEHAFVVVEIGTNHPGEIAPLAQIATPDIAVMTSLGCEHLEHFASMPAIVAEEASLLDHLAAHAVAVIEAAIWPQLVQHAHPPAALRVIHYGDGDSLADVTLAEPPSATVQGQRVALRDGLRFDLPLHGIHNARNALAAVAVARQLGVDNQTIAHHLARVTPMPGRFQRLTFGSITVIHDAYNANPDAMRHSLTTLAAMPTPEPTARRVAILGDMLELGEQAPDLHRQIGDHILNLDAHAPDRPPVQPIILIGPLAVFIGEALLRHWSADRVHMFPDWSEDLPAKIVSLLEPGDVVLLKASRGMALERLIPAMRQRFAS